MRLPQLENPTTPLLVKRSVVGKVRISEKGSRSKCTLHYLKIKLCSSVVVLFRG